MLHASYDYQHWYPYLESAVREFDGIERMDWSEGVTLPELLDWIGLAAARFRPDDVGADSRAGEEFTPRTFRHYQTLGCIDAPDRVGKRAVYRFRQYVQALLLRRLIWERLPSERIATIMSGRSTAELKRLLLEGIEVVPRHSEAIRQSQSTEAVTWKRIGVVAGVELHVRADLARPRPREMNEWLARLEAALRKHF
jgi:DNA-binding transcriptional MerR regulator